MKLYLLTIFTFFALFCQAQTMFGNQQIISIPVGTATITASLYLPDDYFLTSQNYPIIVFVPGRGEWGTSPSDCVKYGPSHFIYNGTWNGQSVNPKTGLTEKFIVVTLLSPRSGASLGICEVDKCVQYFYTNYRCDTSREYSMALSAGAGGPTIYYASFSAEDAFCGSYIQKHGPAAIVPMSAENTNNDPVTTLVTNQTHVWGFGDTRDPHGLSTQLFVQHLNAASPGLGKFTPYVYNSNPCPGATCGHGGWNTYFDPNYRENGLDIYEWVLQFSKNATAPTNQIFTGTVSPLSYCVTASANATGTVGYSTQGTWTSGNRFVVQMSDIAGNFSNPVNLDSVTTTSGTGTISFHVPANTNPGLTYKLRVIARNPAIVGSNSANFTVVLAKNSIAPTTTQNILAGGFGTPLTGTEASTPTSRQWYDGATLISGSTGLTYQPTFLAPGVHLVTLKSAYSCATVQSNAVTVNVTTATHSSRIILTQKADGTAGYNGCTQPYAKGDTFVLPVTLMPYSTVRFDCMDSFTVINGSGQVMLSSFGLNPDGSGGIGGGFVFYNCTHWKLTGTGGDSLYGFKITSPKNRGIGVYVYGRSAWGEIERCDIYKKNAGFWIKEEQLDNNCDPNLGFPNWNLHDFKIHDNYIHNMVAEGMYLGSTAPDGTAGTQHPSVWCLNGVSRTDSVAGAVPNTVLPMRLGNFDIYRNIIDSTNRGGIQLSDADSGISLIHDNHLTRIGFEYSSDQGNGIVTGTYTKAKIYNNYIDSTFAAGSRFFSLLIEYYNNTVLNSGWLNGHSSVVANIELNNPRGNYPAVANDTFNYFNIHDNTVGNKTGANNITGNNQTPVRWSPDSKICNSGTINLPVGVPYSTSCDSAKYILIYRTGPTTHDTASNQTFSKDTSVTRYADTDVVVHHFKFRFKRQRIQRDTLLNAPYLKDTIVHYDSLVHYFITHDSIYVDTSWITNTVKIGAFYFTNGGVTSTQQIDTLKNYLHVNYMRQNITRGGGGTYHVKEANDSGMHVILTVNNIYDGAPGWAAYLDSLFSIARPLVVCFRNEPTQNSTSLLAYLADVAIGIAKAHQYGILVSDGGITPDVAFNAYYYWNTHGKQDSASKIKTAFPSLNFLGAAATKANLQYDTLLTAYRTIGLDLANIHAHQPLSDTGVTQVSPWFHILANYVHERTGLPFYVGEYGTWNHSCQLLEDFSNEIINAGAEYLIYFFGTGNAGQDIELPDCFKNYVSGL